MEAPPVKRVLLIILGVVVVLAAGVYAMRKPLTLRVMSGVVEANMTSSLLDELPDGLHVALCGAGSPLPDPQRSGPCTAIIAGQQLFVVDSGSGSSRVLSRMRIPQGRIDAVFLTHFHSDHIDGLGELMLQRWANGGRKEPAPLYGPPGVEEVARGFDTAYRQDYGYRVAHHGETVVPRSGAGARAVAFALPPDGAAEVLIERDGVRVTAFRVDHVLSGDTAKSSNLETFARDADLLVHEALAPHLVEIITGAADRAGNERVAKITRDILDYHTTPVEAGESAQAAGARYLLFSHIVPPLLLPPMVEIFTEGVDEVYEGPFTVGQDGTLVTMPAGSDDIDVSVSRGL
jgi:ribonuclease Z